jgi:hypothetical protein
MRFFEFKQPIFTITEGQASGATRYSSELGLLLGLIYGNGPVPDINVEYPGGQQPAASKVKKPKASEPQAQQPAPQVQQPVQQAQQQASNELDPDLSPDDVRLSESAAKPQVLINGNPGTLDQAFPTTRLASGVIEQIQKWLIPNFNKELFDHFVSRGQEYAPLIARVTGGWNGAYGWAGGHNQASNAADISFEGCKVAGISVKADTGITLANLTPEALGLYKGVFDDQGNQMLHDKGRKKGQLKYDTSDVLAQHSLDEWRSLKEACMNAVMDEADEQPTEQLSWHDKTPEKYFVKSYFTQHGEMKYYFYGKGNKFEGTREEVLTQAGSNPKWQRVVGDWTIQHWDQAKVWAEPMVRKLSKDMLAPMEQALSDSKKLAHALRMSDVPYIYLSKDGLYLVPNKEAAHDLALKKIEFGHPDGATMKFFAHVGERPAGGTQNGTTDARVEIHIRYANGMFACNPTVRVQGLQAPEGLTWTKLAD